MFNIIDGNISEQYMRPAGSESDAALLNTRTI